MTVIMFTPEEREKIEKFRSLREEAITRNFLEATVPDASCPVGQRAIKVGALKGTCVGPESFTPVDQFRPGRPGVGGTPVTVAQVSAEDGAGLMLAAAAVGLFLFARFG